jgi:hypothetical protein
MSEMSHTFSKSMFLATAEREFVLQRWHYLGSVCLILFISWVNRPYDFITVAFFAYIILNLARCLQPVMVFESSMYRMLIPHAKRYAFYHALFSVLVLSLIASLITFDNLPSRLLSFLSLVSGAMTLALLTQTKKSRSVARGILFMVPGIFILGARLFDPSIIELAFRFGKWVYQYYFIVAIGLSLAALSVFKRFNIFVNKKHEYNPELYEDTLYRDKYFRDLEETQDSEQHSISDTAKSKWQRALSQCFNFLMPKTELRKLLYADIEDKTSSVILTLLVCSLFASAYLVYTHVSRSEIIDVAWPVVFALGIVVFLTLDDELASKKQLIAYLWLSTPAKNRASYMKQLANLFVRRQLGILLFLMIPVAVPHLLLSSSISDRLIVTQFLFWGLSCFLYLMAYNLWSMRNSYNDSLRILRFPAAALILGFNWLAISHDKITIVGLLSIVGVGIFLWILSLRRWKRHALEWV